MRTFKHLERERVTVIKTNYHHLFMDRYYLLEIGEMYYGVLEEKENEMDRITRELVSAHKLLKSTQIAL